VAGLHSRGVRVVAILGILMTACLLVTAGCGGSGEDSAAAQIETVSQTRTVGSTAPAGSILSLLNEDPAEDSALVMGSADFAVGDNRVTFLLVRGTGEVVAAKRGRVLVARGGLDAVPTIEATAENLPVGVTESQGQELESQSVWVTHLDLDEPGQYSLLVAPEGGGIQGVAQLEVAQKSKAPAVGSKAIPSDNPTVDNEFPDRITTSRPADVELLRSSIADAMSSRVPFVVTFATPQFCASRVCGPVVDVVDDVRTRFPNSEIRFIHVEIYENNEPSQGFNQWVKEWALPTEPWTFVVDGSGTIRDRFEGLLTVEELERSVRDNLQ
jgi:hypothetical protein